MSEVGDFVLYLTGWSDGESRKSLISKISKT